MAKTWVLLLFAFTLAACGGKEQAGPETAAARVNSAYLDKQELTGIVPAGTSKQDSLAIIKAYIDRWASQRLLYDAALVNIGDEKQQELEHLIEQYKTDLYTKAYLEEMVKQSVDTLVTEKEIEDYYKANKANFRTPETLVKLRYIRMEKGHPRFSAVNQKFTGGGKKNIKALTDMALQFKSYAFNDSVWTSMNDVYQKLPFITPENRDKYVSGGITYQYPDSTDVYLVKVVQVMGPSQAAPYDYIKPTIKQLIINNRKLELIKKFQKEITDDATKDKKYEVYK
ncbi:hypothetical protein AM493_00300 [Flavobacterium akiainvivens]|uniref:Uncharacterized protein n=1 Tax=Flavobacterium akiainvivens TaxID=1202724 RepID=A0A0M8M700_9FLAO|nr:peptidylprolyl isomerase [Flavobacterium akiainvivens]KOS04653.1 hypothetical protein AM493_00300 [Flavobacterium akiainvivens]SFQ65394.1 PPIC-type PPIASE domain-containing protein [Flavobacterium akiainvivens]